MNQVLGNMIKSNKNILSLILKVINNNMSFQIVLNSLDNNQRSPRRKENPLSPTKELRKLKAELADRVFEIKKQEEDYAQEKTHLIQAHNQQRNQLSIQIKELYHRIGQENQYWESKVDELRKQKQIALKNMDKQWKERFDKEVSKHLQQVNRKYRMNAQLMLGEIKILKKTLIDFQKVTNKSIYDIKDKYRTTISGMEQLCQESLRKQSKAALKQQQTKINTIMQIKYELQQQHKKTKRCLQQKQKQLQQVQAKHNEALYSLRQQIWTKENIIKYMQSKKQTLEQNIRHLQEALKDRVDMTKSEYEDKLNNQDKQWRQKNQTLNNRWKLEVKRLQETLSKINSATIEKQKIQQERAQKILHFFDQREAREEDVKLIENLEIQLIKKQFALEREKQELKQTRLQLDNMDNIYKRIFHSANHQHSHSASKHKNSGSFHLKKIKLPGIGNRSTHPLKNSFDY